VYAKKKPPKVSEQAEVIFKGERYQDVPYFGTPIRGGIRIYLDDKLTAIIKRRLLEEDQSLAHKTDSGELRWNLLPFLESRGVKTQRLKLAETIHEERRGHRFSGEDLKTLYFLASPQQKGEILLGKDGVPANAIALYTTEQPARPVLSEHDDVPPTE
jgi:hypothetical protein